MLNVSAEPNFPLFYIESHSVLFKEHCSKLHIIFAIEVLLNHYSAAELAVAIVVHCVIFKIRRRIYMQSLIRGQSIGRSI